MVYSITQQSMGEMNMVNPVTFLFFTSLKHLMMLLKCNFFRASILLHLIKDTDSMQGHAAQIFFKVETLLINAFKLFMKENQITV